jgi:DNA invertase Pin-like site-specific DNA recombinase
MNEKIKPTHLERTAFVYVRQSSRHQVLHNRESQRRQYELVDKARTLGFKQIDVIDDDLGKSGSGKVERPGFARLVASVFQGEAGAVLALEASRLARNNRDWHHLIDLCTLTEALVIDLDGVYDPRLMNDRLILGLKGTISEFELGLLRQRAQEALRQKVARGEVLTEVPVGYIRTEDNRIEMTPDIQIQEAIQDVFAKFRELGSARQVLLWYQEQNLLFPTNQPASGGKTVTWRSPTYSRIISILKNPIYAGAFVYGRRKTETVVRNGRTRRTGSHEIPRDQWEVLLPDHHEEYITWDEFLRHETQLKDNAYMHGRIRRGAPRNGPALLAGLFRCARCGRKLHVAYGGKTGCSPRYSCHGAYANHGKDLCISFGGLRVEQAIIETVLEAIQPVRVEATLDARNEITRQGEEKRRALQRVLEKAQYDVRYAQRQYESVDPDNRLVAAELEKRWETALQRQNDAQNQFEMLTIEQEEVREEDCERLYELGEDLETLWNHPDAPVDLKKRILRTVLEEIVVDVSEEDSKLVLKLHWVGGVHTPLTVTKNRRGRHRYCTDRNIVDLVRDLAHVCDDRAITNLLNRLGYRTGVGNTWTEPRVKNLRNYNQIPAFDGKAEREWVTMEESASLLGVSPSVIRRLLIQGILPGCQAVTKSPWVIKRNDLDLPEVQKAIQAVHEGRRIPQSELDEIEYPLFTGDL